MDTHILNNHSSKEERKHKFKCYCEYCDFGSFSEIHYQNHLITKKHILINELIKDKIH